MEEYETREAAEIALEGMKHKFRYCCFLPNNSCNDACMAHILPKVRKRTKRTVIQDPIDGGLKAVHVSVYNVYKPSCKRFT